MKYVAPTLFFCLLVLFQTAPASGQDVGRAITISTEDGLQAVTDVRPFRPAVPPLTKFEIQESLSSAVRQKLHPYFQQWLAGERIRHTEGPDGLNYEDAAAQLSIAGDEARFDAIVHTSDPSALAAVGLPVHSRHSGFATTQLRLSDLERLLDSPAITYVEPGSENYLEINQSLATTGAHLLHNGFVDNTSIRGQGALICVYDTGIDFTHEDFLDRDGETRIVSMWDQTIDANSTDEFPEGFNYGVEYDQSTINRAIQGDTDAVRQEDRSTHGTRVAGVAAGNGQAYRGIYTGVAPEAELIIVKGGNGSFSETRIIDGINYCGQRAEAEGKPVVVNLSLGGQSGPHDGTRLYEQAIDDFSETPGRVVVNSAGNNGDDRIHTGFTINAGASEEVQFEVPEDYTPESGDNNDQFRFDGWYDGTPNVTVTVTSPPVYDSNGDGTPDSSMVATFSPDESGSVQSPPAGTAYVSHGPHSTIGGGDLRTLFYVYDASEQHPPASGTWTLTLENHDDTPVRFDGWLYRTAGGLGDTELVGGDMQRTISSPGNSHDVVTVGSFVSREVWPSSNGLTYRFSDTPRGDIADHSSWGPTRDGRNKPELTAPGMAIASSMPVGTEGRETRFLPGNRHYISSGTSLAAPHVTGAIALLLAEDPTLDVNTIKQLLTENAQQDEFTGDPNRFGAGKLDAFQSFVALRNGSTASRRTYGYAQKGRDYRLTLSDRAVAFRFTPEMDGIVTGFNVHVAIQTSDRTPVAGEAALQYALYADDDGQPGEVLTDTLQKQLNEISPSSITYFDLLGARTETLQVQQDHDYHIVFFLEDSDEVLQIYGAPPAHSGAPRSLVGRRGSSGSITDWSPGSQLFSSNSMEFNIWAEVTSAEGVVDLPVKLLALDVAAHDNGALLQWETAGETDNAGFEIEHAFEDGPFETIGFVDGAGTTSATSSYDFHAESLPYGRHRFRLRQINSDGSYLHSREVSFHRSVEGSYELSAAYPNPFDVRTRMELALAERQSIRVELYDMLGRRIRVVMDEELEADRQHYIQVDGDGLSSGLYFVRITGEQFSEQRQIMMVR